jgi:Zn-dependent protease
MTTDITYIVIVIIVILLSMTLHEAMHGFVSYWLGDDTAKAQGRLTLNPIKHIDPFLTIILPVILALSGMPIFGGAKPVPFNPLNVRWGEWGAALVAIAGPLTNFVIAFVAFGVWALVGTPTSGLLFQVIHTVVLVNLGFFIFNLIPIPPLDGSRVLYALAPDFAKRGMEAMERFGIIVVFGIVILAGQYISSFMVTGINFFLAVFTGIFHL